MPSDLQQRIDSVRRKATLLGERVMMLERAQTEHLKRIDELTQQIATLERQLEEANRKLEFTSLVSALAPTAAEVRGTRERLNRLVCEIDRCIADLND